MFYKYFIILFYIICVKCVIYFYILFIYYICTLYKNSQYVLAFI